MLPDDDKRYDIETCRSSESVLKKWFKINDKQLVHLFVVWWFSESTVIIFSFQKSSLYINYAVFYQCFQNVLLPQHLLSKSLYDKIPRAVKYENLIKHTAVQHNWVGQDGDVSVATHYRLDGLGIKSQWVWNFPHPSRLGPSSLLHNG